MLNAGMYGPDEVDLGFDPDANNTINTVVVQPDGRILV